MHPSIRADQNLRELALAEARNAVGPDEPLSVFLQQECLSPQEYAAIAANPTYQRYLKDFKAELTENGFSFASKARVLAEDLLADVYLMAKDPDTPAQMRVKTLENLVEWGRLAPKTTALDAPGAGFSITINLPTTGQTITVGSTGPAQAQTPLTPPPAPTPLPEVEDVTEKPALTRAAPVVLEPLPDVDTELYYELTATEGDIPDGQLFA